MPSVVVMLVLLVVITIAPSSAVEPSAVAVLSANKHSLLSITAEYTPVILAVLMFVLMVCTVFPELTTTVTPLITRLPDAPMVVVTALAP